MSQATIDDYAWLTSAAAAEWLEAAVRFEGPPQPKDIDRFRHSLTAVQTQLVWQLAALRRRARARFRHAERMFFTDKGLQQATDDRIAGYKATTFTAAGADSRWADLCCGIGGDLVALAQHVAVTGFDADPIVAALAAANLRALQTENGCVVTRDVERVDLSAFDAWHLDPDRRQGDRRTTRVEYFEPNESTIDAFLQQNPNGAIKLAPATQVAATWRATAELEWIGHDRQCQQLLARFGAVAVRPGQRTATTLDDQGRVIHSVTGDVEVQVATAVRLGPYLYEPKPAILAARLTHEVAAKHELQLVQPGIAYLTGDQPVLNAALAGFAIQQLVSLDERKLRAELRAAHIGQLEIKKRGVDVDLAQLRRRLNVSGEQSATLLIFPHGDRVLVAICRRLASGAA